jgi:hypothetical protein
MKFINLMIITLFFVQCTSFGQWTTYGSDIANSNTGNVGIGITSPSTRLHVNGDITADAGLLKFANNWTGGSAISAGTIGTTANYGFQIRAKSGIYYDFAIWSPGGSTYLLAYPNSNNLSFGGELIVQPSNRIFLDGGSDTYFSQISSDVIGFTTAGYERLRINDAGQVGIGVANIPSGYKLAVASGIIAEKMRVKLQSAGWPDYVFEKNYQLLTLKEVEEFITQNKHLPGVPSAVEIGKDGLDVGETQATLLKKIEELTLYMIEMNKEIKELKNENNSIKNKLRELNKN